MTDPLQPTGGTQRSDTARDPNLPRQDDPVRGAQQQDDSTHATAGVQLPGGTKVEITSDGPSNDPGGWPPPAPGTPPGSTQAGAQVTIPFGGGAQKPADTSPHAVNPDAPASTTDCVDDDGRSYPDGWVIFKDNQPVKQCVRGFWVAAAPAPDPPAPGDYPTPSGDPGTAVASADPTAGGWPGQSTADPYGSDPSAIGGGQDPFGSGDTATS